MELSAVFGWMAAATLIAAVLAHQVRSMRIFLLAGGVCAAVHFVVTDGQGPEFYAAIAFVAVNAARLYQLWARARGGSMTREEQELFDHVMRIEDPSKQNRLRDLMQWRDVEAGEVLIEQNQIDPPLIYIATGRASIKRDGQLVNECGAGEFVGEISHISGEGASATVAVVLPMRMAQLDRDALAQLTQSLPEIGRAVDSAFNRSLAVKVIRMNEAIEEAQN
ncbi:cyclic nucleotide-binding domain-containing protein [uncultured Erythrobacter sp.]|uniref:cyclic nucleotide-binding domain-containing protein n=1 Tax=uncultured Erythrobacter sp. TaxID=263913 RepID=UPI002617A8C9|nr:cyclic nucleotide-binding domain-containing protein [uncultured Erythrobacter sp.]